MKYVAFHTGGFYAEVYNKYLKPSSIKHGVSVLCKEFQNMHSWHHNTRIKAKFLLSCLEEDPSDVAYLDVDSEIMQYPRLLEEIPSDYDIAVHYLDWFRHWRNETGRPERELYNPVMVLRNNDKVKSMLVRWIEENEKLPYYEQRVLDDVLKSMPEIRVFDLPVSYACPAGRDGKIPAYMKEQDVVIFQHQISRVVKANGNLI